MVLSAPQITLLRQVADPSCVLLYGFKVAFGGGRSTGFGMIYDTLVAAKKFEPKYRLTRVRGLTLLYISPLFPLGMCVLQGILPGCLCSASFLCAVKWTLLWWLPSWLVLRVKASLYGVHARLGARVRLAHEVCG